MDWRTEDVTILIGDVRARLGELPAESVHCVVTSPPYWGLRDYGTATWEGGDPACDHREIRGGNGQASAKQVTSAGTQGYQAREACRKCGARRVDSQLGLEATPEEYVCRMVEVFGEVRRVLRADGTLWLNLGDSYASGVMGVNNNGQGRSTIGYRADGSYSPGPNGSPYLNALSQRQQAGVKVVHGLKPKDLIGVPWRLALALQADGWWLRSDIIWSKPNPMPESVTDRPTTAHEHVFLLARSGSATYWTHRDGPGTRTQPAPDWRWANKRTGEELATDPGDPENWQRINLWRGHDYFYDAEAVREPHTAPELNGKPFGSGQIGTAEGISHGGWGNIARREYNPAGRNLRSVWTIATQPYPEAHFATFPEELARRCIATGTSERGCCPECEAPWRRVLERTAMVVRPSAGREAAHAAGSGNGRRDTRGTMLEPPTSSTTGWQPTCAHAHEPIPATVLDPFAGSGTTLAVARRMGRRAVGVELQADYLPLIRRRVHWAIHERPDRPAVPVVEGQLSLDCSTS